MLPGTKEILSGSKNYSWVPRNCSGLHKTLRTNPRDAILHQIKPWHQGNTTCNKENVLVSQKKIPDTKEMLLGPQKNIDGTQENVCAPMSETDHQRLTALPSRFLLQCTAHILCVQCLKNTFTYNQHKILDN